jgi:hypothetical protein
MIKMINTLEKKISFTFCTKNGFIMLTARVEQTLNFGNVKQHVYYTEYTIYKDGWQRLIRSMFP